MGCVKGAPGCTVRECEGRESFEEWVWVCDKGLLVGAMIVIEPVVAEEVALDSSASLVAVNLGSGSRSLVRDGDRRLLDPASSVRARMDLKIPSRSDDHEKKVRSYVTHRGSK